MGKVEIDKDNFLEYSRKIQSVIDKNKSFFFYFSPDPDAVGVSIALALFLKNSDKSSMIFLPEGYDHNLDFLIKIANYNNILILSNVDSVLKKLKKEEFVFVSCDTPTYRLLPDFKRISKVRDKYINKDAIEIDHHFGGDSEQIYQESVTLFCQANSCCDILANYFQIVGTLDGKNIDIEKYFPRNVVLSLIVGMCYDTQFGKFLVNEKSYNMWFSFLSERLRTLTWISSPHMKSASEVFDTINKMSEIKIATLKKLIETSIYSGGVGFLILPPVGKYESLAENGDSSCIVSKISSDIANMIPERAGKIGIFCYYDDTKKQYFVKIRRSSEYKDYDLRNFEKVIIKHFGRSFIGGGGHPGATSFRFKNMEREKFIKQVNELYLDIVDILNTGER